MVTLPAALPVTTPEPDIVATEPLLLVHVPPVVASDNVVVSPTQTWLEPVTAAGLGFMVIGNTAVQLPAGNV
jgi:hypothetical protein